MPSTVDPSHPAAALVGAWTLETFESRRLDGTDVRYPLGPDATGIILYTPDGFMSAQIMRPNRPWSTSRDSRELVPDELVSAAEGYLAYSGPYELTEDGAEVHHDVTVSLLPSWLGGVEARAVGIDGDLLELAPPEPVWLDGERRLVRLVWRRARR